MFYLFEVFVVRRVQVWHNVRLVLDSFQELFVLLWSSSSVRESGEFNVLLLVICQLDDVVIVVAIVCTPHPLLDLLFLDALFGSTWDCLPCVDCFIWFIANFASLLSCFRGIFLCMIKCFLLLQHHNLWWIDLSKFEFLRKRKYCFSLHILLGLSQNIWALSLLFRRMQSFAVVFLLITDSSDFPLSKRQSC